MKTIETVITVFADGSVHIPFTLGLSPGAHRAVLVVDEAERESRQPAPLAFKMLDWTGWPADATYRREELYDDSGR